MTLPIDSIIEDKRGNRYKVEKTRPAQTTQQGGTKSAMGGTDYYVRQISGPDYKSPMRMKARWVQAEYAEKCERIEGNT